MTLHRLRLAAAQIVYGAKETTMPVSANGWPGLPSESRHLYTWTIPGASGATRLRLRHGSAGFLLCHLALWMDQVVEDLVEPLLDDWGYAYRPVRGYSTLSNHASGTAMDLNATDHPLGVVGTFSDAEADAIHKRLGLYKGCIRWGGDYRSRKDEMHFEIDRDLPTCERVARDLLDSPRGLRVLKSNPSQKAIVLS